MLVVKVSVLFLYFIVQVIFCLPASVISFGVHCSIVALTVEPLFFTVKSLVDNVNVPVSAGIVVEPVYCNSKSSIVSSSSLYVADSLFIPE